MSSMSLVQLLYCPLQGSPLASCLMDGICSGCSYTEHSVIMLFAKLARLSCQPQQIPLQKDATDVKPMYELRWLLYNMHFIFNQLEKLPLTLTQLHTHTHSHTLTQLWMDTLLSNEKKYRMMTTWNRSHLSQRWAVSCSKCVCVCLSYHVTRPYFLSKYGLRGPSGPRFATPSSHSSPRALDQRGGLKKRTQENFVHLGSCG